MITPVRSVRFRATSCLISSIAALLLEPSGCVGQDGSPFLMGRRRTGGTYLFFLAFASRTLLRENESMQIREGIPRLGYYHIHTF